MLTRTHTTPGYARSERADGLRRSGLELSRESIGGATHLSRRAVMSMSEPHLPSTVDGPEARNSPFTAIPETFFQRRTGMAWLSSSRSGLTASSSRARSIQHEPSFEVEHLGDIKAVDSGWLDDDVEEVMVVSKKEKKRRPLSAIVEATEALRHGPSPLKRKPVPGSDAVNANQFEYIGSLHTEDASEAIVARRFDDGRVYTVKLVRKSGRDAPRLATRLRNEQDALKVLSMHRASYVNKLWWSFEDDKAMYLVTDRTDSRSLRRFIEDEGPLGGLDALLCAIQLASGISAIHDANVVHSNLRPESILIGQGGHIVICDLGQAKLPPKGRAHPSTLSTKSVQWDSGMKVAAAITYHAPEKILGWEWDCSVDWWSFGLVVYWTFTGQHPFVDEQDLYDVSIVRSKILHGQLLDDHLGMGRCAHELVTKCLQRNSALRIDSGGVKTHEYFQGINWDDVARKRIQAPFALLDPEPFHIDILMQPEVAQDTDTDMPPFSFEWRRDVVLGDTVDSGRQAQAEPVIVNPLSPEDDLGDKTFMPVQDAVVAVADGLVSKVSLLTHDPDISILPDVVPTPHAGLPTPPNSRISNLRKYSSLNFDELDDLNSIASSVPGVESSGRLGRRSHSAAILRKSKSIFGLSHESLKDVKDVDADDGSSSGSGRWNRLRKRSRPPTPVSSVPPAPSASPTPPVPVLPKGVQHIGSGIGYTYRGELRRPALSLASLTPRTCHGIFTGRRSKSDVGKRKEQEQAGMAPKATGAAGDDWNPGLSPEYGGLGRGGAAAGLGWELSIMSRFGMAEDASFAGPDSTLRLVTSPSTPRVDRS
ncbi:kinase-like domain-containing protein [Fomes fomentarius]|nr:kinase-like domain-containing protein [Fomes fomentarius]